MIDLGNGTKLAESQVTLVLIGAIFGGVFALLGQFLSHLLTIYRERVKRREKVTKVPGQH